MQSNRRVFILHASAAGCALAAGQALAQTAKPAAAAASPAKPAAAAGSPAMVDEKDPTAVALGYVADTTKADQKKYPKHTADQKCNNCQLYSGKPADKSGPCSLFQGKHVAGTGWCSAWVKKA